MNLFTKPQKTNLPFILQSNPSYANPYIFQLSNQVFPKRYEENMRALNKQKMNRFTKPLTANLLTPFQQQRQVTITGTHMYTQPSVQLRQPFKRMNI